MARFWLLCVACDALLCVGAIAPTQVRVDLQEAQGAGSLFVSLDGTFRNVSISWALPPAFARQTSFTLLVTRPTDASGPNATVFSRTVTSATPLYTALPRSTLAPSTGFDVVVAVTGTDAGGGVLTSAFSQPLRFFTSASNAEWTANGGAPVWAPKCAGAPGPSTPQFALFKASPTPSAPVLYALLYVTASPAIYNDPWNVTKLFSGFKLSVNGTLIGVGPGHAACGPYAMGPCTPTQPVDAFDVTASARAAYSAGSPMPIDIAAYSIAQPEFAITPAVQAVLVLRYSPEGSAPDTVLTTSPGSPAWSSFDADGLYGPGGNKDSGWYTQPREDMRLDCAAEVGGKTLPTCTPGPFARCTWQPLAAAPGAFGDAVNGGTLALAGKATQAVQVHPSLNFASATKLGPGWWLLDPGFELQGGMTLQLTAGAAPNGAKAVVQLSDQLAVNGSALWNTLAGMHYQDVWTFPPTSGSSTRSQLRAEHHEMCEFRYVELILTDGVSGAPLDIDPSLFTASLWRVHYRYDPLSAARVSTTSADLDAVFRMGAFTLETTTMDIYSDSNTRQRSFDCMADDNVAALSHYSTTTELALPRMMAAQVMSIGPTGYISGNWADWTVLPGLSAVYDALWTGDTSFAAFYFDALVANHTYTYLVDPSTGLVTSSDLDALIDTSGGSDDGYVSTPVNAVVNAWSYLGMRRVADLGRWLGRDAEAAQLDAVAQKLRSAFQALMVNASGVVCDGLCSNTPHTSVHASFYAMYAGLFEDSASLTASVAAYIRVRAVEDPVLGVPCGAYPVQFLLAALYRDSFDHGNAAYGVLTATTKHSWLNMMQSFGATSTMECWLPEELPNLSFSHVWSSSPALIVPQYLFGVLPTSPGFATLDVFPQPGPVESGSATLPSVRGPIGVAFKQTVPGAAGGCTDINVILPGGVTARVGAPMWGDANTTVKVDGVAVPTVVEGDFAVATVAAGAHTITTC
jgi:hypothetical protein